MWTIEEKEHATKTRRYLERLADAAERIAAVLEAQNESRKGGAV